MPPRARGRGRGGRAGAAAPPARSARRSARRSAAPAPAPPPAADESADDSSGGSSVGSDDHETIRAMRQLRIARRAARIERRAHEGYVNPGARIPEDEDYHLDSAELETIVRLRNGDHPDLDWHFYAPDPDDYGAAPTRIRLPPPRWIPGPRGTFWIAMLVTLYISVRNFMHWPHSMPNCVLYHDYHYCFSSCALHNFNARFASIHHAAYDKPAFFNSTVGETIEDTVQRTFYAETPREGRWYAAKLKAKIPYQVGNGEVKYRVEEKQYCPASEEWDLVSKGLELKGKQHKVRKEVKEKEPEIARNFPYTLVDVSREEYERQRASKVV